MRAQSTTDHSTTLLIGLGSGGAALLPYLVANDQFELVGACDTSGEAVGIAMAKLAALPVYGDATEAIEALQPQLIIDATGDPSLPSLLDEVRPANTSVVTGEASRLLWELLSALEGRRRSDLRYDRLLNDLSSGIVVVQNEKVRYVNPAFLQTFDLTAERVLGRPYANLLTPRFRERDAQFHVDRVSGRDAPDEYETQFIHGDGGIREVMVRACRSDWDGRPASLVIITDVTEVRELQRERERFFRFMVHELRAPLSPLVTVMPLLDDPAFVGDEKRFKSMIGMIHRSVDRLRSFIDDFLDLSKLDRQTLAVKHMEVDLVLLVEQVVETQQILARDKDLTLTVNPWKPFPVRGDPVVIKTLVQNLVNNAIKYTPAGAGGATVDVARSGGHFELTVTDTGSGLTEAEQEKLFQEYGRIKRTQGIKGTGLGLALVSKLLQACGGEIEVVSEGRDKGSAFTFRLPTSFGDQANN